MVLLSDKIMAQAEIASSNPLRDALTSAPIALAMFAALLAVSELMSSRLCESSREQAEELGGECTTFARYISFFAYALLVAYVTVLIDAGMYYRRQQQQQQSSQAHQQQPTVLEPPQ